MAQAASGDIIYVKHRGYQHFGIYAGDGRVIHYYKESNPLVSEGIIMETSLSEFRSGSDTLYVLNGDSNHKNLLDWLLKRLFGENMPTFSPRETVERARSKIGQKGYSLVNNNCEHFALWCKTGIAMSSQVEEVLALFLPGIEKELAPSETAKEKHLPPKAADATES